MFYILLCWNEDLPIVSNRSENVEPLLSKPVYPSTHPKWSLPILAQKGFPLTQDQLDPYPFGSVPIWIGTQSGRYPIGSVPIWTHAHLDRYLFRSVPIWTHTQLDRCTFGSVHNWVGTDYDPYPFGSGSIQTLTHLDRDPYYCKGSLYKASCYS